MFFWALPEKASVVCACLVMMALFALYMCEKKVVLYITAVLHLIFVSDVLVGGIARFTTHPNWGIGQALAIALMIAILFLPLTGIKVNQLINKVANWVVPDPPSVHED